MKPLLISLKRREIIIHIITWMLLFTIPLLVNSYSAHPQIQHLPPPKDLFVPRIYPSAFDIIFNSLLVGCFYINALVLIPQFIYKKKYSGYILAQVAMLATITLVNYILFFSNPADPRPPFLVPAVPYILIIACSTTYKIVRDKLISDQLAKDKENESLKTELSLLRSQVSPHFMFNVLNNIVSMARLNSKDLEPTVIKLSSLMRYMLYDADEEKVELAKEIDYLQSYIDLQRHRYEDTVSINVSVKAVNDKLKIEPMLLIPFVENAFKHGTGLMANAEIDIVLLLDKNDLHFHVMNRYDPRSLEVKDKASGIGLANVQRRLNLLYENDYNLQINNEGCWFKVLLTIKLAA